MSRITLVVVLTGLLTGCGSLRWVSEEDQRAHDARRRLASNCAATLYEAGVAVSQLGQPALGEAIQANALAIIKSQGFSYPQAP